MFKNPSIIPLYWQVYRDSSIGLLQSPIYIGQYNPRTNHQPASTRGFEHCSAVGFTGDTNLVTKANYSIHGFTNQQTSLGRNFWDLRTGQPVVPKLLIGHFERGLFFSQHPTSYKPYPTSGSMMELQWESSFKMLNMSLFSVYTIYNQTAQFPQTLSKHSTQCVILVFLKFQIGNLCVRLVLEP